MPSSNDWYPKTLPALPPFHSNLTTRATATGTTYGLSALQVAQIATDSEVVTALINYDEAVVAFAQAWTEYRNIMLRGDMDAPLPTPPAPPAAIDLGAGDPLPGIEERTRMYRGIVVADPDYTPSIGELYGFVAPAGTGPGTPSVTAAALTQSQVQLSISKAGYSVLAVDGRINGGAWSQIGVATMATYLDSRSPLVSNTPELLEYRVQGIVDNTRTGPVSGIVGVWTVP